MIGNDVVDLQVARAQSNWRRKGFLNKVFNPHEQFEIDHTNDPDGMVWLLWSMKEAAYKAHQRLHQLPRKLNWKQQKTFLESHISGRANGYVQIGESVYSTSSETTTAYVHTSAVARKDLVYKAQVLEGPSAASKKALLETVSGANSTADKKELLLQKDQEGIPFISSENRLFIDSFSLSHHGRFSAFCLALR